MSELDQLVERYRIWLTRRLTPGIKLDLRRGRRILAKARLHGVETELWERLEAECVGDLLVEMFASRHIITQYERSLVWENKSLRDWMARELTEIVDRAEAAGVGPSVQARLDEHCPTPTKRSFDTYHDAARGAADQFKHEPDLMPAGMYPCPGIHSKIHLSSRNREDCRSVHGYLKKLETAR